MTKYQWQTKLCLAFLSIQIHSVMLAKPVKAEEPWWDNAVVYEIWPRSFQDSDGDGFGDFKGMTSRLPYLSRLGIDAIWLTPIFEAPSYHGYDFQDFFSVESDYGTMQDLEEFLAECKKRGIRVLADLVLNHISDQHPWFLQSKKMEGEFTDAFVWASKKEILKQPWSKPWDSNRTDWKDVWILNEDRYQAHKKRFPEMPEDDRPIYYYAVFTGSQPDLNFDNPFVVKKIKEVAKFWLDKGFSGFRLDAGRYVHEEVVDGQLLQADSPKTLEFWKDFNSFVKSVNPEAYLVTEIWQTNQIVSQYEAGGLDAAFDFAFSNELVYALTGKLLVQDKGGMHSELQLTRSLGQALVNNFESKAETGISLDFFSPFLSNHDQLRFALQVGEDTSLGKLAATILFTMPGTPYIYYGEEIGQSQPDFTDEQLRFDDIYKRAPMYWDDSPSLGFTSAEEVWVDDGRWVPWLERHEPWWNSFLARVRQQPYFDAASQWENPSSLLRHYQKLIQLRKEYSELRASESNSLQFLPSNGAVAVYRRVAVDNSSSLVVINPTSERLSISLDHAGRFTDLLTGAIVTTSGKTDFINVPPKTAWILK